MVKLPGAEGDAMQHSGKQQRRSLLAVGFLVAAPILVLFGPVLISDRSLAMRDAAHFYHPLLEWTSQEWLDSGPPLWNPLENTGLPLLADASSSLFYPGRLLLLLAPLDFSWRYKLYVVAHVVLAAGGVLALCRVWQASWPAAAAAAVAYSCGGSVVFQHANVVFLIGAAWLPYAAWAADRMLVHRSWRAALALGVVLALMVLGGDPQMAMHALLLAGLYALVMAQRDRAAKGPDRQPWLRPLGLRLLLVGAAALCGLLLSAIQVLPSSEAAAASDRAYYQDPRNLLESAEYLTRSDADRANRLRGVARGIFGQPQPTTHHERAYDFSVAPWRLVELVWPNIGGRMFPIHRRWMSLVPAEGRIWTPTLYLGLLPLVLCISQWSLIGGDVRRRWLSWTLLLFTLGSFGWYGLGWCVRECYAALGGKAADVPIGSPVGGVYWLLVTFLPTYVSFRYPAKLMVVAALAMSLLAARGWDQGLATPSPRLRMSLQRLSLASVVLLVATWFGFAWLNQSLEQGTALGRQLSQWLARQGDNSLGPFDLRGAQRDVYLALVQTALVASAAAWILQKIWSDHRPAWQIALLCLLAVDLSAANYWLVPSAPASNWRVQPSAAAVLAADPVAPPVVEGDEPRVFRGSLMRWRPATFARSASADRMAQIAAWERDTLFPKYGLNHGISLVESYGSLKPVDFESLLVVAKSHGPAVPTPDSRQIPHPAVLRMLGTQYLILPKNWKPELPGEQPFATPLAIPASVNLPEGAALWRLTDPFPRTWIVHHVEQLPLLVGRDLNAVDARTREVYFPAANGRGPFTVRDLRRSAVVESNMKLELPSSKVEFDANEASSILSYDNDRVQIAVKLARPGLVVLSDLYSPGWVATAQSANLKWSVPILRTNRICRGVLLPAGEHTITMVYQPLRYTLGMWISIAAWLAASAATFLPRPSGRATWREDGHSASPPPSAPLSAPQVN